MQTRLACAGVLVLIACGAVRAAAPPAAGPEARARGLLERLDADEFRTRQEADAGLRAMGKAVLPLLRRELARTGSCEVRHRLEAMVDDLTLDERVGQLVQMLGAPDERLRASADYALHRAGAAVVPLLRKEVHPGTDPQRRRRLEKIIAELSPRR